jgi:hypothetical protein
VLKIYGLVLLPVHFRLVSQKRGAKRYLDDLGFFGWWRSPVAHLHGVQEVAGSNPVHPTASAVVTKLRDEADLFHNFIRTRRAVAQPGSALRSGRRGRWFESSLPDKRKKQIKSQFKNLIEGQ